MKTIIVVLSLLIPASASAQSQVNLKPAYAAIIVGNVGDLVSTELMLSQRPDLREGNPIAGQHRAQRIAVKAAGTAVQVWIVRRLGQQHPKLAKGLGYSIGAYFGGITVWNSSR